MVGLAETVRTLLLLVPAAVVLQLGTPRQAAAQPLRNPDGSCVMFPPENPLHQDISKWPVHRQSSEVISTIGTTTRFHADFSGGEEVGGKMIYYGIPINVVDTNPAKRQQFPANGAIKFIWYGDESDKGKYPFPINASIEGTWLGCSISTCDGDRHVLVQDNYTCLLYEGYYCQAPGNMRSKWKCGSGAVFNLSSAAMPQRPVGWTSADAAGLPIRAGLVTIEDVFVKKAINHAIRFTAPQVRPAYAYPASHLVTGHGPSSAGWMGMRARLQASFNCATKMRTQEARVICNAMKRTGLILADVGSSWFITGEASPQWQTRLGARYDQFLTDIKAMAGSNIQVVVPPSGLCLCEPDNAYNCDSTKCPL